VRRMQVFRLPKVVQLGHLAQIGNRP
jgi:hypothetical protein